MPNLQETVRCGAKKINVLQIIGGLDRGGAESLAMNIVRNIDMTKFEITFLCFSDYAPGQNKYAYQDEAEQMGIKVYKIKDNRYKRPLRFMKDVRKIIHENKIEVVHSHVDMMSSLTLLAAKMAGIKKRIAHSHNTSNNKIKTFPFNLIGFILRKALPYIATDFVSCGEMAGKFLYGKRDFIILPNGIDLIRYGFAEQHRTEMRQKYGIGEKDRVWLNIGRLDKQKNQRYLLEVFANYVEKRANDKLFIIGNGPEESTIRAAVGRLDIINNVYMIPACSDVYKYYSMSDAFVMTSLFEGLPFVLVEAQANGLPCLLSNAISKESDLTGHATFMKDTAEPSVWVDTMLSFSMNRYDGVSMLKETPYNICSTISKVEEIYAC